MPKILLVNQCGLYNGGDEALYLATTNFLLELWPDAQIAVATLTPNEERLITNFKAYRSFAQEGYRRCYMLAICMKVLSKLGLCKGKALKYLARLTHGRCGAELMKEYIEADVVVLRGGDNWSEDYGHPWQFIFPAVVCGVLKKKSLLLGESVGPFKKVKIKKEVLNAFLKLSAVVVREDISYNYLYQFPEVQSKLFLFPDMAFFLPVIPEENERLYSLMCQDLLLKEKQPCVAIFPSSLLPAKGKFSTDAWHSIYLKLIRFLLERGYQPVLMSHVDNPNNPYEDDLKEVELIARKCHQENMHITYAKKNYGFVATRAFFQNACDFVISGRMHPCISALTVNKPGINIAYSHKSLGIIGHLFSSEQLVVKIPHDISEEDFCEIFLDRVEYVINNYQSIVGDCNSALRKVLHKKQELRNFLVSLGEH